MAWSGKNGTEFLVGCGQSPATFGKQLCGAARVCREQIYVEGIALHASHYIFKFGYSLVIRQFGDR